MKNVLVTGANGFIAKRIAGILKQANVFVIGTSRTPGPVVGFDAVHQGVLGMPLMNVFEDYQIDAVVHCAYDKDEVDNIRNAEGTVRWAEQAEDIGVPLQIFMSSISADPDALSPYGLKKYETEQWFLSHNQIVFRLGLVVGSGGMFGRIISTVKKSPVIPLIDSGKTLMYPSDPDTISRIILDVISQDSESRRGRTWCLQQEIPVSFVEILKEIRRQYNLIRIFVPVPYVIVSSLLGLLEKVKFIKLEINTSNMKWARQVQEKNFTSDLKGFGYSDTDLNLLIEKTLG